MGDSCYIEVRGDAYDVVLSSGETIRVSAENREDAIAEAGVSAKLVACVIYVEET